MKNKKNEEKTIIKEAGLFSASKYLSEIIYVIRGFLIAKVLGPSMFGFWNIIKTILTLSDFTGLGTSSGMLRQVPYYKAQKKTKKIAGIQTTALTWKILISLIISLLLVIISFTGYVRNYGIEFRITGILFIIYSVHLFIPYKLRSEQKIKELSIYEVTYSLLNTIIGLSLLFRFYISGLLIGTMIAQLIMISYMLHRGHLSFKLRIDPNVLKELFKIGMPMMILFITVFFIHNVDKITIFFFLGSTLTGYYSLATFISTLIGYIPYSMSITLFPRMMYKFGRTQVNKSIEEYFLKPLKVLSGLVPIIIGLFYINIDIPIIYLLPKYLPSMDVLRILILGFFFASIFPIPQNFLIAINKHKNLMLMMLVTLVISTILDITIIKIGGGIVGVAYATMFSLFISSFIAILYSLLFIKLRKKWWIAVMVYIPFVYGIIVLLLCNVFLSFENLIILDIVRSIVFMIFMIPLIYYVNKQSKLFTRIMDMIR